MGASIAGLLTARVLSDVVDEVVVLERERLTDSVAPRGHVAQGRHIHLLLSAGLDRLVGWFPGIEEELELRGAAPTDGTRAWVFQGGGYRAQGDWGRRLLSMTRPLLEDVVRGHVTALPTVRLEDGVVVDRVAVSGGRVTGVVVEGTERSADLVVDCAGRSSRLAHQLQPRLRPGNGVRRAAGGDARADRAGGRPAFAHAASSVPPHRRDDHRRALDDRRRRRLPVPRDGRAEAPGDGPDQPLRPAGHPSGPDSLPLARSFNDVLNLVEPPTSLARPGVVARVVAASIQQRRHPVSVAHPRVAPPT